MGAAGRLGRAIAAAGAAAEGFCLVAALGRPGSPDLGRDAGELAGIGAIGLPLRPLDDDAPAFDVLVDASTPAGTPAALELALARRRPLVTGVTGLAPETTAALERAADEIALLHAPNLAPGVALLRALLREALRRGSGLVAQLEVEIVEAHHRHKRDAPSGTAKALAADVQREATGPEPPIHSLRLGERAGDHAVHLGLGDESLTLAHRVHSRRVFARGALLAARWIRDRPPGTYHMHDVLLGATTEERGS